MNCPVCNKELPYKSHLEEHLIESHQWTIRDVEEYFFDKWDRY